MRDASSHSSTRADASRAPTRRRSDADPTPIRLDVDAPTRARLADARENDDRGRCRRVSVLFRKRAGRRPVDRAVRVQRRTRVHTREVLASMAAHGGGASADASGVLERGHAEQRVQRVQGGVYDAAADANDADELVHGSGDRGDVRRRALVGVARRV